MSRKWERMVQKNIKTIEQQQRKQGKEQPKRTAKNPDGMQTYKGRSVFLPLFLIGFSVFFILVFYEVYEGDLLYWVTGLLYFLLGLYLFFLRRPYLRIGRDRISTRRLTGEKFVEADQIEFISIIPGTIVIQLKQRKERWIFSKMLNRFNVQELEMQLRDYAKRHQVDVTENMK